MKNGKETKTKEVKQKDPEILGLNYDEFFNNRFSLPAALKEYLKAEGLDWRFLNAAEFRKNGNMHRAHWIPFKASAEDAMKLGLNGLSPEGTVQRGDTILGVRKKQVSKMHRDFLDKRNRLQAGYNKEQAAELRRMAREAGVGDQAKVYEGYEDDGIGRRDQGYNDAE